MKPWLLKIHKQIDLLALLLFARLVQLCSLLVPYRFGVWLGGVFGFFAFYFLPRERKKTLEHLRAAFGNKDEQWIRRTARDNFVHLGKAMLEIALISPRRLSRVFRFHGREAVQAALKEGKGAIYVTGHLGNWELMAYAGVANGFPLSVIAAPIRPQQINDMIVKLRARMGVKTIVRGTPGAAKELIRVFKENRVLAVLIDQDTDVEGAFVDFFGKPAWTPTGAASMAVKFGAPILFGHTRRDASNNHEGWIEGPLHASVSSGDEKKEIVAKTALLTKKIETCILNHPEQWVWMHRRWRTQQQ